MNGRYQIVDVHMGGQTISVLLDTQTGRCWTAGNVQLQWIFHGDPQNRA